ncbi:MAG: hypothetical protein WCQ87_10430 [Parabacteroides sp.]
MVFDESCPHDPMGWGVMLMFSEPEYVRLEDSGEKLIYDGSLTIAELRELFPEVYEAIEEYNSPEDSDIIDYYIADSLEYGIYSADWVRYS